MMKHSRITLVLVVLLVTPLLLSGLNIPTSFETAKTELIPKPVRINEPSYEAILPITADGDAELEYLAGEMSWDGDGSPGDPYIIEGYSITNNSNCIDIKDVSLAFEINDCYIVSETGTNGDGIVIENATQVSIYDTIVSSKSTAVKVIDVSTPNLDNLTIDNSMASLYLNNCTGATINECVLYDTFDDAISINESNNTMLTNNIVNCTFSGEGIQLFHAHFATIDGNHVFDCDSSGIYVEASDNATILNNVIHDNLFFAGPVCGIHIYSADYVSITGNIIYDNKRNGIYLQNSDWSYIFDNDIYGNSDHGIDAMSSSNGTILQNDIYDNGWDPLIVNAMCGIYIGSDADDWLISENTIWNNTPSGISVEYANDIQIYNNEIFNNTDRGIYGTCSSNREGLAIIENEIYGNGYDLGMGGIVIYGYQNCTIHENVIYNNTSNGILSGGNRNNITNNEIYDTNGHGISVEMSSDNLVMDNMIYDNTESGVFLYSISTDVIYNIIYDNDIGIHLYASQQCNMYGNDIGWNNMNALQESSQTNNVWYATFDDFGNHWHDHVPPTGEGINRYPISNGTHNVAYDIKPDVSLNMTVASPISYEILETGNVLVWEAYALNPWRYHVWYDDVWQYSEPWDGHDLELNVDGLPHGFTNVTVVFFHISGHGLGGTSNVTVSDLTPPSDITGPTLVELTIGDTLSVQYNSTDPSGIVWAVNDTINFAISSTGLLTSVTDLAVGEYVVQIVVTDPFDHNTTLDVTITVSEVPVTTTTTTTTTTSTTTTTTTTTGGDIPTELILVVGGAGVIVILIVGGVVLKKKRG